MKNLSCKLLVIGAGPGGYAAAIRAGQLGIDTIIVDKQKPGGTCLNVGCIPSKAFIHAANEFEKTIRYETGSDIGITVERSALDLRKTVQWKDGIVARLNQGVGGLLKKSQVQHIAGVASIVDGKTVSVKTKNGEQRIVAENLLLATGSVPVELPFLPFEGSVISSTGALALSELPKELAVVGGGYIGLELGIAFAKMGAKVTILDAASQVLPQYGADLVKPIVAKMQSLGMSIMVSTKAKGLTDGKQKLIVEKSNGDVGKIPAEKVLVTVGRKPNTKGYNLEGLMLDMHEGFVKIDNRCRTSMRGVYAIGDVTGEPMLAHRAIAQGEMTAEIIAGKNRDWDKRVIPAICFTDPEIVIAGLSPEEAKAAGHEIVTNLFPFMANGRAMTMEAEEGFVRIVARKDNHLVLGIQAVGGGVAELSASFSLAIEMGARLEDIAGTIHAHPTQSEAFQEAAMRTLGHALHI